MGRQSPYSRNFVGKWSIQQKCAKGNIESCECRQERETTCGHNKFRLCFGDQAEEVVYLPLATSSVSLKGDWGNSKNKWTSNVKCWNPSLLLQILECCLSHSGNIALKGKQNHYLILWLVVPYNLKLNGDQFTSFAKLALHNKEKPCHPPLGKCHWTDRQAHYVIDTSDIQYNCLTQWECFFQRNCICFKKGASG